MNTWATHAYDEDGKEIGDPYGVPTGMVPRVGQAAVRGMQYKLTPEDEVEIKRLQTGIVAGVEFTALGLRPDPIQKAVDDYILMERKAKAWDVLLADLFPSEARVRAFMDELLKPPA
jgi:hypothetical protein